MVLGSVEDWSPLPLTLGPLQGSFRAFIMTALNGSAGLCRSKSIKSIGCWRCCFSYGGEMTSVLRGFGSKEAKPAQFPVNVIS